ncbi:MAG: diacylglycerol/lipid kinase family protein, partial [bacterium]
NEVVNGIMRLPPEKRPLVGYLPLGTTNDMAASFRFPHAPEEVIARMGENHVLTVDVGQFGDIFFGYVAAFGSFTDIPFQTPQNLKNTWGYLAYLTQAMAALPTLHPTHARVAWEGGVIEDDFVMGAVMNSTSMAGIIKLPAESVALDDGLLEVFLIRSPHNPIALNNILADVLAGDFNTENVLLLHTKKVSFEFLAPVSWTLDGENGGTHQSVEAVVHHRALRLLV